MPDSLDVYADWPGAVTLEPDPAREAMEAPASHVRPDPFLPSARPSQETIDQYREAVIQVLALFETMCKLSAPRRARERDTIRRLAEKLIEARGTGLLDRRLSRRVGHSLDYYRKEYRR